MEFQTNDRMTAFRPLSKFPLDARTYVSSIAELDDLLEDPTVYNGLEIVLMNEEMSDNYVSGIITGMTDSKFFVPYSGTYYEDKEDGTRIIITAKSTFIFDQPTVKFRFSPNIKNLILTNSIITNSKTITFFVEDNVRNGSNPLKNIIFKHRERFFI